MLYVQKITKDFGADKILYCQEFSSFYGKAIKIDSGRGKIK